MTICYQFDPIFAAPQIRKASDLRAAKSAILDPADVMGADYPSETFRVLKKNEIAKYGEYRTARLVLQAWDRLRAGELQS